MSAERLNAEKKVINNNKFEVKMKKNIIKVAFVAAIAMVSGINVFNAQKSEVLSDTVLANVEALAQSENGNVKLPCVRNDDDYCVYTVELVSGEKQERKEYGLMNYR